MPIDIRLLGDGFEEEFLPSDDMWDEKDEFLECEDEVDVCMGSENENTVNRVHMNDIEITREQVAVLKAQYKLQFHVLPHNPHTTDYVLHPFLTLKMYMIRLTSTVGWKFVLLMTSVYLGSKGFLGVVVGVGQLPYFKEHLNVDGARYQAYQAAATMPWAAKALMGVISDSMPISGYFKKYYVVFASIVGTTGFVLLYIVELSPSQAYLAAIMFMMVHFERAFVDLLCEGAYAAVMRKYAFSGPDVVTWVWSMVHVGGLFAAGVVGPLADAGYYNVLFLISIAIAAQVSIPTLLGFFPEKRLPHLRRGIQLAKIHEHRFIFTLAVAMAGVAIGLGVCNMVGNNILTISYAITCSTLMVVCSFWIMPIKLAQCNLFLFLVASMYVSITGGLDYFYTANQACNPGGPQFDYTYYNTWSIIAQSCFGCLGVLIFQMFLSHWEFRRVFWVTIFLRAFAATVDIIIVQRWNLVVGISDKWMYMIGYNSLYQVIDMLEFMATVVLTTKMCPNKIESTVYALLAGFQNFGKAVSSSIGVVLIQAFGIKTKHPCDFTNLTALIVLCHIVLPLSCIPLTFILLPKAYMTDTLDMFGGPIVQANQNRDESALEFNDVREKRDIYEDENISTEDRISEISTNDIQ
eukprot:CFRG0565T1